MSHITHMHAFCIVKLYCNGIFSAVYLHANCLVLILISLPVSCSMLSSILYNTLCMCVFCVSVKCYCMLYVYTCLYTCTYGCTYRCAQCYMYTWLTLHSCVSMCLVLHSSFFHSYSNEDLR